MPASFFDNLLAATNPTVDAVFAASYQLVWQGRTIAITAVFSAQEYEANTEADLVETDYTHAFEINTADLVFAGETLLPQAGMQFRDDLGNGTSNVYEVMKTKGGRCYNTIGDGRRTLIYTRLIRRNDPNT